MIDAYPLSWPAGWPRTSPGHRKWGNFGQSTRARTINGLLDELRKLGAQNVVISSDLRLRNDGLPYSNQREPDDPGIAVYFDYNKRPMVFACDSYNRDWKNIRAIALTIEALRGIERWGASDMMERAFTGFAQLPQSEPWWLILGFESPPNTESEIRARFRELSKTLHPDVGGSHEEFCRMQQAVDTGLEVLEQR